MGQGHDDDCCPFHHASFLLVPSVSSIAMSLAPTSSSTTSPFEGRFQRTVSPRPSQVPRLDGMTNVADRNSQFASLQNRNDTNPTGVIGCCVGHLCGIPH